MGDKVRVRDQHARRERLRLEHGDRLARLHEQRLVASETFQLAHDRVVARPIARRLPDPSVHDQLLGSLGDIGMQVVLEHAQRSLLLPTTTAQVRGRAHQRRLPMTAVTASRTAPLRTSWSARASSGARTRSGPGR